MEKYNLSNLTDIDFEEFCKDILKYKEKKEYRTFRKGKDKGIDILSLDETFVEVGQAKQYIRSNEKNLIFTMKKEKERVEKLVRVDRYILFTNLELSVRDIEKIIEIMSPYLKLKDIYDGKIIQDILNEKEAKYILDKWEKLWMPTPFFLNMINEKFKNREYEYKKEEIIQDSKKFIKPQIYEDIIKTLEEKGVAVIHGEPGVGKTTLARNVVSNYISNGYEFIYGYANDLSKIDRNLYTDNKTIILIDDFLGSNALYLDMGANDNLLEDIIKKCYRSKNKRLLLASRTYIYNNALQKLEKYSDLDKYLDKFLLTNNSYTYMQKAKILYNHLYYNGIMEKEEYKYILENELYFKIIIHDNFCPKTIAMMCEHFEDICKEKPKKEIIKVMKNPEIVWEKEYNKLNEIEKIILHVIVFFGKNINEKYIEEQFWKIIDNEKSIKVSDSDFRKGINTLLDSFIMKGIDDEGETILNIINNNIVDFIIKKVDRKEIRLRRYIDNAIYIDVLRNMYDLLRTRTEIKEKIVNKLENEFAFMKHAKAYWLNNVFHILEENCGYNLRREAIILEIIDNAFKTKDFDFIEFLIEQESSKFFDYILVNLYNEMNKSQEIIENISNINLLETLMRDIKKLEDMGFDICFIHEDYDILIEKLKIAVAGEIEISIKLGLAHGEKISDMYDDIDMLVLDYVKEILEERYLYFLIDYREIYDDVLENIKKKQSFIESDKYKKEAKEFWGDIEAEERLEEDFQNERKEIIKMFENRVPKDKYINIKVTSYIKVGNDIVELKKDDEL